jgi:hypothetical protein
MAEVSLAHLFVKALNRTGVQFPAAKAEIIAKLESVRLQISDEATVDAAAFVRELIPDSYESGAAFMCAFYNASYRKLYAGQQEKQNPLTEP